MTMYQVPYVIEDTGRGERAMDIYSRLLQDRVVFIGTAINDAVANTVIAQMLYLRAADPKKDISLYINSPGGYISACLAIYDTMKFMGYDINTYCLGETKGMSALLLATGSKGKRFALPNSRIMLHQPFGGVGGASVDIELQAKEIQCLKQICIEVTSLETGQPVEKIARDIERDFYMSPSEALSYGLIDKITYQPPKSDAAKMAQQ